MPGDHVILTTPRDLEDAKRQLHLAVVFLCGREYLANGTITLSKPREEGDVQSSLIDPGVTQTQASNNGVGDKMPTPALTELQMLEIRLKRQEYTGQDTTETIGKIMDEIIKQPTWGDKQEGFPIKEKGEPGLKVYQGQGPPDAHYKPPGTIGLPPKIPVGSITGMYCSECQGELRQNGACMICTNCGTTTGCS